MVPARGCDPLVRLLANESGLAPLARWTCSVLRPVVESRMRPRRAGGEAGDSQRRCQVWEGTRTQEDVQPWLLGPGGPLERWQGRHSRAGQQLHVWPGGLGRVAAARLRGRGLILGAGALSGRSADEGPALTRVSGLMLLRTGPRTKSRTKRVEQRVLA